MLHLQSAAMMFIAPGMPFGQVEAVAAVLVAMFGKVSGTVHGKANDGWLHEWTCRLSNRVSDLDL